MTPEQARTKARERVKRAANTMAGRGGTVFKTDVDAHDRALDLYGRVEAAIAGVLWEGSVGLADEAQAEYEAVVAELEGADGRTG